jgi:hypothetical protein
MRSTRIENRILRERNRPVRMAGSSVWRLAFCILVSSACLGAQPGVHKLLPEGTVLNAVDGKLSHVEINDVWLFELSEDVNNVSGRIAAGAKLEVLPSAMLELLIADVNDREAPAYRLSAMVTQHNGRNYLFPTYYLPLSKLKGTEAATPQDQRPQMPAEVTVGDKSPDLTIPPEVIEQLKNRRPARGPQREDREPPDSTTAQKSLGRMLINRVGRITAGPDSPAAPGQRPVFAPYALGWNIGKTSYVLLPCRALEQAQQMQAASPDPIRFNVAGLVTEFRGRQYLLLQRAIRAYSYGNFDR